MDRSRWKVKDYQRALASRGAKISGRKKELQERLEAYERNDNFGYQVIISDDDPLPHFPDISKFRTLTDEAEVPKIARSHVEQYVLYRQELDAPTKVTKAMEKGEKMVQSDNVLALSFFHEKPSPSSSSDEGSASILYLSGIVEAAMRSKTTYSMKLVIDGMGEPLQSHCECPAGKGPTATCKHIVAILLVLVKFAEEGTLQVQLSCTETLQTFKRPAKSHQGSPVQAENLGKQYDWDHDPRPKKYQKWTGDMVMDHIYNATTNFCAESGLDIGFRHAMPVTGDRNRKGDLAAVELDHDYLKYPLVEQ